VTLDLLLASSTIFYNVIGRKIAPHQLNFVNVLVKACIHNMISCSFKKNHHSARIKVSFSYLNNILGLVFYIQLGVM